MGRIPAWATNLGSRVTKAPKVAFLDTGLAAALLRVTEARLSHEPTLWGGLLENFVGTELLKQASWHRDAPECHHFRPRAPRSISSLNGTVRSLGSKSEPPRR